MVNRYELATGAKLNLAKTEAMWLGSWRTRSDAPFGLTWVNKMKICGIWYSNGTLNVDQDNWQTRLEKLESKLNSWKPRSLSLVGKALIVNVLGASKLWFLAKVLPLPKWVVSRYNKLVYPFVWGSKIETVSRKSLTLPFTEGGLALVDLITKCKALKVAATVSIAANPDTDDHYLLKYFIGSQLARLGTEWSHLRDNSTPSALTPTKFYDCVLRAITDLNAQVNNQTAFTYSSKECYEAFLKTEVTRPRLHWGWSSYVSSDFCLSQHWLGVRDQITENFKNDLLWLITLRGVKVRDSLHSWGYINSDSCAVCHHKETIDHCFLNCHRVKRVWAAFGPALSSLLATPFRSNVKTVYFFQWTATSDKNTAIARYLIKSILHGIWFFRNKSTFHNGTEDHRAIVRYIRHDIATRLHVDFSRMTEHSFLALWCHDNICEVSNERLIITL